VTDVDRLDGARINTAGKLDGAHTSTACVDRDRSFTDRRRAQLLAEPDPSVSSVRSVRPEPSSPEWPRPEPLHPEPLHAEGVWLAVESCTAGALAPDGLALAFVSDRDGFPALWVTRLDDDEPAVRLDTGPDHVRQVSWSPDGRWLTCQLAAFGGEQTRVVALRPDGSERRELGGGPGRAGVLGVWRPDGGAVGVTEASRHGDGSSTAYAVDPASGRRTELASGPAAVVCALSRNGRHAVVRVGRRGARRLLWVDIPAGRAVPLLAAEDATVADARFSPGGDRLYLHTDSGQHRPALLSVPLDRGDLVPGGRPEVVAARPDADVELFALRGRRLAVVWNVDGISEVELREPSGEAVRTLRTPAEVITSCAFSPNGQWLLIGSEGPTQPPHLTRCWADDPAASVTGDDEPLRLVPASPPSWAADELVRPVPLRFPTRDGLELTGWWYAPHGVSSGPAALGVSRAPMPAVLWLHGGPEAQERPTFAPLLQELAAAGVAVFAPNVRGSSGYGREFVNADNHERRFAAISDVAEAAEFVVAAGLADPARLGVAGRSYGGYLTLSALVHYPELFRVGVDVCGMADLQTFFAYTEPWIATAATSKYGDPSRDRELLRELSPIHRVDRLAAPLLVVHGEHDTNVPLVEAEQVVQALRDRGATHQLLLFPDEGHEIHGTANRATFVREVVSWLTGHLLEVDEQTA
jgi:dipeptidyl aminopeptidase/acylaminoacyl peptidase